MIQGITTPNDHIKALETLIENATKQLEAAVGGGRIDTKVVDGILSTETGKDVRAAIQTLRDIYQQYVGVLGLLANLAIDLNNNSEFRESIENALVDAISQGVPITYKRVFDRFDIGVGVQVEDADIDEDQEG